MYLLLALVALVVYLTVLSEEHYDSTYAYQNNVQPFYLSRQAMNLWSRPAHKLCNARVKAECAKVPFEQRVGCVQAAQIACQRLNANTITNRCIASLPKTICKRQCTKGQTCCKNCVNVVRAMGVCRTPDINI